MIHLAKVCRSNFNVNSHRTLTPVIEILGGQWFHLSILNFMILLILIAFAQRSEKFKEQNNVSNL